MGLPVPEQYGMQSTIQLVIKANVITLQTFPWVKRCSAEFSFTSKTTSICFSNALKPHHSPWQFCLDDMGKMSKGRGSLSLSECNIKKSLYQHSEKICHTHTIYAHVNAELPEWKQLAEISHVSQVHVSSPSSCFVRILSTEFSLETEIWLQEHRYMENHHYLHHASFCLS